MRKSSKNFLIPIILLSSLLFDFNLASKTKSATLRIEDGLYLRCFVWYDNEWNMDLCTTSSITTTSNTATVHCKCRFVSVFLGDKSIFWPRAYIGVFYVCFCLILDPLLLNYTSGMDIKFPKIRYISQNWTVSNTYIPT